MSEEAALYPLFAQAAVKRGFLLTGAVDIDLAPLAPEVDRYDQWIASGYQGAMDYLVRGRDRRADPRLVFPEAQSVFCAAIAYPRSEAGETDPARGVKYARYLQGPDYHRALGDKLEDTLEEVATALPQAALKWKVCVDTSAVLERAWGALAGLGWIGKNSMLIHPKHGSYLFIAEALVNVRTGLAPKPLPNYCGHCTRCLQGCPTQAFARPGVVNANRCLSYWTLEKRGELGLNEQDRRAMGNWVAGCDICQEVCPFNRKTAQAEEPTATPGATRLTEWAALLKETEDEYRARVGNSALKRVKPGQFSRNLAIALGNAWERVEGAESLLPLVESRLDTEQDPVARAEWVRCREAYRGLFGI